MALRVPYSVTLWNFHPWGLKSTDYGSFFNLLTCFVIQQHIQIGGFIVCEVEAIHLSSAKYNNSWDPSGFNKKENFEEGK